MNPCIEAPDPAGRSLRGRTSPRCPSGPIGVARSLARAIASTALLGAILLLSELSRAAGSNAAPIENAAPVDVMDTYTGVVNMKRCCNCHTEQC